MKLVHCRCDVCGSEAGRLFKRVGEWYLERCAGCGVVRLNPRPSERDLERLYSENYYVDHDLQDDHTPEVVEYEIDLRMESAARLRGEVGEPCRWLDIGCASGYLIAAGKRLGCDVEGVEISEWAARFAVEQLALRVFCGSLDEYVKTSPRSSFNLVTAMAYLEHSPHPQEDLRLMARLLEPGGAVVIRVPNMAGFDRVWHGPSWRGWSLPYHQYHFTPKDVLGILKRAELRPYGMDLGFWNPVVHLREALRGDGVRADHPLEGRPNVGRAVGLGAAQTEVRGRSLRAWLKARLSPVLSGRDMIVYARK